MEYLVQYGRSAFLGRFRSTESAPLDRDQRVLIDGPRGLEVGSVLAPVRTDLAHTIEPYPSGAIVRTLQPTDIPLLDSHAKTIEQFLDDSSPSLDGMTFPIEIVDAEMLFDGTLIVHILAWSECDATPLIERWSQQWGRPILLFDVQQNAGEPLAPPPSKGCGKPGCGSESGGGCGSGCGTESGGCSSGSCSRGSVKSADELTNYFAGLRQQMEQTERRLPLH